MSTCGLGRLDLAAVYPSFDGRFTDTDRFGQIAGAE